MSVRDFSNVTTRELHVYVDGDSGSDTNDGSSWANAKKTIPAGISLIPHFIRHNTCLHLKGSFVDNGFPIVQNDVGANIVFLIDGGTDVTVLNGPHTADISSVSSIGLTTASWTADQWAGYIVEVTSGPASGQRRTIQTNTTTTITPIKNWTVDPGAATFQIVRPATTLTGSIDQVLGLYCVGRGRLHVQNIYGDSTGPGYIVGTCAVERVSLSSLVLAGSSVSFSFSNPAGRFLEVGQRDFDNSTFLRISADTSSVGVSNPNGGDFHIHSTMNVNIFRSVLKNIRLQNCSFWQGFDYGSRVMGAYVECCTANYSPAFRQRSGYATTKCDSASGGYSQGNGLLLMGSNVRLNDLALENNSAHGIESQQSSVRFEGVISGSGNGGAGVYVHSASSLITTSGLVTTVTGTVGDIAVSDPTIQEAQWTDLASGDVAIAGQMTLVKEI